MLGSTKCKKDLNIVLNHKLNMSQECDAMVKKPNVVLGYFNRYAMLKSHSSSLFSTRLH